MQKVYVQEKTEKTVDDEEVIVVEVHLSKPDSLTYLVFLEK